MPSRTFRALTLGVVLLPVASSPVLTSKSTIATKFEKSRNLYHSFANAADREAAIDSTTKLIAQAHAFADTTARAALLAARGATNWHLGRTNDAIGDGSGGVIQSANRATLLMELGRFSEAESVLVHTARGFCGSFHRWLFCLWRQGDFFRDGEHPIRI